MSSISTFERVKSPLVIWSDESRLCIYTNHVNYRVQRRSNKAFLRKSCVEGIVQSQAGSMTFWRYFMYPNFSLLVKLMILNQRSYIQILDEKVQPSSFQFCEIPLIDNPLFRMKNVVYASPTLLLPCFTSIP